MECNKMIKLSIIIPVYNQEELVIRCLESIPVRDDIEIIVVDDGSTDNTYYKLIDFCMDYKNLTLVLKNKHNKGVGYSKNKALKHTLGEYIGFIDSDDYVYTDLYNKVVDELDGTDIVYMNLVDNKGHVLKLNEQSKYTLCGNPCKFIKRSLIGKTKFKDIRAGEDWFFNNEIQEKTHTEKYTDIVAYHYNFPRENSLVDLVRKGEL